MAIEIAKMTFPELKKAATEAGIPTAGKDAKELRALLTSKKEQPVAAKKTTPTPAAPKNVTKKATVIEAPPQVAVITNLSAVRSYIIAKITELLMGLDLEAFESDFPAENEAEEPAPPPPAPSKGKKVAPPPPEEEEEEEEAAEEEEVTLDVPEPSKIAAMAKPALVKLAGEINNTFAAGLPISGKEAEIRHSILKWIKENGTEVEDPSDEEEEEGEELPPMPAWASEGAAVEVFDPALGEWQKARLVGVSPDDPKSVQVKLDGDESEDLYDVEYSDPESIRPASKKPLARTLGKKK